MTNTTINIITNDGPVSRDEHFKNLNVVIHGVDGYFDLSREDQNERMVNSLHRPWEITEEIYEEFLEMLPPVNWSGGSFYMLEFSAGNARGHYFQKDGKFYAEEATYPPSSDFKPGGYF